MVVPVVGGGWGVSSMWNLGPRGVLVRADSWEPGQRSVTQGLGL